MSIPKKTTAKRIVVWGLVLHLMLPPLPALADVYVPGKGLYKTAVTPPAANALPQPRNIGADQAVLEKPGNNKLVVHQKKDKAILEWNSFNIGADAWTHFDQQGRTDWSALNRIYDQNPSLIFGRLSADGKVFLINQNGMIFGPNAKIQTHDLVASALDIDDADFLQDNLKFKQRDYIDGGQAIAGADDKLVENQGAITVDRNGTVTLLGPKVKNSGTIDAPAGRVELAAAREIAIDKREISGTPVTTGTTANPNTATNQKGAMISADGGVVEMWGEVVNQEGVIRSVAAVDNGGDIRLKATQRVSTGADSRTICPITDSTEKLNESFDKSNGAITVSAPLIEHKGYMAAPSGAVTFTAAIPKGSSSGDIFSGSSGGSSGTGSETEAENGQTPRILLHSGSVIDVSGETVDLTAQDRVASMQLNSVQLRDDQGQKSGTLKGQTISFDTRTGTAIGNNADAIKTHPQNAKQKNVDGGSILMQAHEGEIIQKQGASLNLKGGQINYAGGLVATTRLVSGRQVFDVSDAPQWRTYDRILGSYEKRYDRFGVVKSFADGPYEGGGTILRGHYSAAYSQGGNAGSLTLEGRRVVLDGSLDTSVFVGAYQTRKTERLDVNDQNLTDGLARPGGGKLVIGYDETTGASKVDTGVRDQYLNEAIIANESLALDSDFGLYDALPEVTRPGAFSTTASLIPVEMLNASGLETIQIFANTRIATEAGAHVKLPVGSKFTAAARSIEHLGTLEASGGSVTMIASANKTTVGTYDGLPEGIVLGDQSVISVAGLEADYRGVLEDYNTLHPEQNEGGTIILKDVNYASTLYAGVDEERQGQGIIMAQGAKLDVSGGYTISPEGKLSAGSAGTLELVGPTLSLAGEIAGRSLSGADGGTLKLHAENVVIRDDAAAASGGFAGLILTPDDLAGTGFSTLEIGSQNDLVVEEGVAISPSYTKMLRPASKGRLLQGYYSQAIFTPASRQDQSYIELLPEMVDGSSIFLKAGQTISPDHINYNPPVDSRVVIAQSSNLSVSPGGTIALSAPVVDIAGSLQAQAGIIEVNASITKNYETDTLKAITLRDGARLDVSGTLIPDSESNVAGLPATFTPLDAGTVTLATAQGSIDVRQGAVIDLSGSRPADYYLRRSAGTVGTATQAGAAGSLDITYSGSLTLAGTISAGTHMANLQGAGLTIYRDNSDSAGLNVSDLNLAQLLESGFDSLSLSSDHSLVFDQDLNLALGRYLSLDAPTITATADVAVNLQAPWVELTNTSNLTSSSDPQTGTAGFTLTAQGTGQNSGNGWLQVSGDISFDGFASVTLNSAGDLALAERSYDAGYSGGLTTAATIRLAADQVYPGIASDFTIAAPGRIVIDRHDTTLADNAVAYSAGGRLVLQSAEIHNYGSLLAPAGEIVLCNGIQTRVEDGETITEYLKADRVYLAQGSRISTLASVEVNYGTLADAEVENSWQLTKGTTSVDVTAAPEKNLIVSAGEIIQREEAEIDVRGGGGIFAYGQTAGVEGSVDPLSKSGRLVILPGTTALNGVAGEAVYLEGGAGLAAGVYTILPEAYAFLPGAIVLEEKGASSLVGRSGGTIEGYGVVQGYRTVAGTDLRSGRLTDYAVRSAEAVLAEGHYTVASFEAGDGGKVRLNGDTTILSGTFRGEGAAGYQGGILALGGDNIVFKDQLEILGADFNAQSVIDPGLSGLLNVAATGIERGGFETVRIGEVTYDEEAGYTGTRSITVSAGTRLRAENLEMAAIDSIRIEGADGRETVLRADGEHGTFQLTSRGEVYLAQDAELQAVSALVFDAPDLTLDGGLSVDNSTIALRGDRITFADRNGAGGGGGLTITPELWEKIRGNETIELLSRSDVRFDIQSEEISRWAADDLLRIDAARLVNISAEPAGVTLSARTIQLRNTAGSLSGEAAGSGGTLALSAENISVGHGDLAIDGFQSVRMTAVASGSGGTPGYITFLGKGELTTGASLSLTADAVRTDLYRWQETDGDSRFEAANFSVAAAGGIAIDRGSLSAALPQEAYAGLPGALRFSSEGAIRVAGAVLMPAGQLSLTAANGLSVDQGAEVYLAGDDRFAGGTLKLTGTDSGNVSIAAGADVNLDAGGQGDAGSLEIEVQSGAVSLEGSLSAAADGGDGGRFSMKAQRIDNLDTLLGAVQGAGFTRSVSISSNAGDLTVGAGARRVALSAEDIRLAADGGALTIANAQLTASDADGAGGIIELLAGGDPDDPESGTTGNVEIRDGALLTTGTGGRIDAAAARGTVNIEAGSRLDLQGGTAHFRARRDGNAFGMILAGAIDNAAAVTAEAVAMYDGSADTAVYDGGDTLTAANVTAALGEADDFMTDTTWAAAARDSAGQAVNVRLIPGIEFQSDGAVTISGDAIDLSGRRFTRGDDTVAGTLTVRAADNLVLDTRLMDNTVTADSADSWALHLAAGADLDAADRFATIAGQEAVTLSLNEVLFSYAGGVGFASSGDVDAAPNSLTSLPNLIANTRTTYTLGSFSGTVSGVVGGDLNLEGGVIETATGDIRLAVGGDLNFGEDGGAIRTTGRPAEGVSTRWVWTYADGGAIDINVGGAIDGQSLLRVATAIIAASPWDAYSRDSSFGSTDTSYHYTADYTGTGGATQGIAAMAGDDVSVQAGGDIACQVGTFGTAEQGGGDLTVYSGSDITGRYLVREGQADLTALGNIGLGARRTTLELCAVGEANALALGGVELDGILNPTLFAQATSQGQSVDNAGRYLSYAQTSGVNIVSVEGSIGLLGNYGYYRENYQNNSERELILPPSLALDAGGDILIGALFKMVPSSQGNLSLVAGGDVKGADIILQDIVGGIDMVDWDPAEIEDLYAPGANIAGLLKTVKGRTSSLHAEDADPIVIAAGGNIENIAFTLPKQALIAAGGDIVDIQYLGQHTGDDDFSLIHAGGDIRLGVDPALNSTLNGLTTHKTFITQGGAGTLLVQAGGGIDLGASDGITAVGDQENLALAEQSALLAVVAGYDLFKSFGGNDALDDLSGVTAALYADTLGITSGLSVLFDQIRDSGRTYSQLLADGKKAEAEAFVARFREEVLYDYFALLPGDAAEDQGDINMVNSKIKTVDSSEGIFIVSAGDINVGRSTLPKKAAEGQTEPPTRESGIFTEAGGGINVLTLGKQRAEDGPSLGGDINVNESRIMTFLGGDITIWADQGDINAGRGSKGAIIKAEVEYDPETGLKKYKPPVQGSGIRALSYDPDGPDGPKTAATAGDGYIFAPEGEIDAGEAGISVTNIFLAATKYANVQNIEVAGLSVGMPVMVDTGAGMDALAGSSDAIAEVMDSGAESISAGAKERMDKAIQSLNENLVKILNVEVVSFGDADENKDKDKKDKE